MTTTSSLVFSGIAPHPPIMVPEVGQEATVEVRNSIDAMAEFTKRVVASGAETIVLISPHAPLQGHSFVTYPGPELRGDFSNFRAPETQLTVSLDEVLLAAISSSAATKNLAVITTPENKLDHGTTVPLCFLLRNGWKGQAIVFGYSFLSNEDHLSFGSSIQKAIDETGRRVAFIASGDLSHRLKPQAPAGYNPTAYLFDEEIVDALRCGEPNRIVDIDQDLRKLAGECGYRSMLVAIGASRALPWSCEVISYEAPFGVGYLVAQLTNKRDVAERH